MKYARILDNTWWDEQVPTSFKNSSYLVYGEGDEEGTEVQYKWSEYLSMNGNVWRTELRDDEDNLVDEFATFSRDGYPVDVPEYTSDKIEFITEREFKIYVTNDYLIHLFTDYPLGTNPKHIDFSVELNEGLNTRSYKWKGQILTKTFEKDGIDILEKEYSHTRDNDGLKNSKTKKFYWYKADGTKELLKTQNKDIPIKSDQVADLIKQTKNAIEEAYAFTVGTPIQAAADAYFLLHADKVEQDKRTGGTLFRDQIASEVYDVNDTSTHFLFSLYDTSHLTHNHGLGKSPTIQKVLVDYLTFE